MSMIDPYSERTYRDEERHLREMQRMRESQMTQAVAPPSLRVPDGMGIAAPPEEETTNNKLLLLEEICN